MANRRFEMYQYRQIIHRLRMGESDRAIAKTKLIGRTKCGQVGAIAQERGWLASSPLPDDGELAAVFANASLGKLFGEMMITEITPSLISEYKTKRREEGASPRTINYELTLMSHAFNLARKEWEWIKENPVSKVSKEKVNNQIERWLTLEEEKKLINNSPEWLKEIIIFALNTGMRQGEILDLKWSQVDLARKTITIFEQKNQNRNTIPLNESSFKILQNKAQSHVDGNSYVFHTSNGTRIHSRNLLRAFYGTAKIAGIENFRFHDLRHTFATRLVQAGIDLYTVQKLGRWKIYLW